jgi:hypothetical protein
MQGEGEFRTSTIVLLPVFPFLFWSDGPWSMVHCQSKPRHMRASDFSWLSLEAYRGVELYSNQEIAANHSQSFLLPLLGSYE